MYGNRNVWSFLNGTSSQCNNVNILSGIQVQLTNQGNTTLANNATVLFNLITSLLNTGIYYNHVTGEFVLPANKNYYISWWVAVDGTENAVGVQFALIADNRTVAIGASMQTTCQLSGFALLTKGDVQMVVSLRNASNATVNYADTLTQANLVIIELPGC
jgi:hypothetical protein